MNQAQRIIKKFGGIKPLRVAFERAGLFIADRTIGAWLKSGRIPRLQMLRIQAVAKVSGVYLSEADTQDDLEIVKPKPNILD